MDNMVRWTVWGRWGDFLSHEDTKTLRKINHEFTLIDTNFFDRITGYKTG
jgi:hypothetical protein